MNMLKETKDEQPISLQSSKSRFTFLPDDSKGSVRKIYSAVKKSDPSSSSQISSHLNGQSSIAWTGSENDIHFLKDCSSGGSSKTTRKYIKPLKYNLCSYILSFSSTKHNRRSISPRSTVFISRY